MTTPHGSVSDHRAAVYRYHEQVFRLALLVVGDIDAAAALVERAYRHGDVVAGDAIEAALLRALLVPSRSRRAWRWRASDQVAARAALSDAEANQFIALLAALLPSERLVIGLAVVQGMQEGEIDALLGDALPTPAEQVLRGFRLAVLRTLTRVDAAADPTLLIMLDRALEGTLDDERRVDVRRLLLKQPEARVLRDALGYVRNVIARAIPALIAVPVPPMLLQHLLTPAPPRARWFARPRLTRAHGMLVLIVVVVVGMIVVGTSLQPRRDTTTAARAMTAHDVIDAAIHRFDRAPLSEGIVHEQLRVGFRRGTMVIERWYDYASPHRVRVAIRVEGNNQEPLMEISSIGQGLVQYRYNGYAFRSTPLMIDATVSEEEAQAVLSLVRNEPVETFFGRALIESANVGSLFLAQARASASTLLGETVVLGRRALLVTYHTAEPPIDGGQPRGVARSSQVVLTFDAQTASLLDVAVFADSEAESTAQHPFQTQSFEVVPYLTDDHFLLPESDNVVQQKGVLSAYMPASVGVQLISLQEALHLTSRKLLALDQVLDMGMRGRALAIQQNTDTRGVALLYEGEFRSILLYPSNQQDSSLLGELQQAGDMSYRILRTSQQQSGELGAEVYRTNDPDERTMVLLIDAYATSAEREATLQRIIASMTPITEQSLPVLMPTFTQPLTAGAHP